MGDADRQRERLLLTVCRSLALRFQIKMQMASTVVSRFVDGTWSRERLTDHVQWTKQLHISRASLMVCEDDSAETRDGANRLQRIDRIGMYIHMHANLWVWRIIERGHAFHSMKFGDMYLVLGDMVVL
jgi:hypothetical protein